MCSCFMLTCQVAEHLKRRAMGNRMASGSNFGNWDPQLTDFAAYTSSTFEPGMTSLQGIPHRSLLAHLSEAATALKEQQKQLQQHRGPGGQRGAGGLFRICQPPGTSAAGMAGPEVPVVYKQWHPEVTVLFADICGYTAMSNSVEPEQVCSG